MRGLGQPSLGADEAFQVLEGPGDRRIARGTSPERNSAVTTSAVIPGSRWVDQPPLASCLDRKNFTARSIVGPISEIPDSCRPYTVAGRQPRQAIDPSPARLRSRNCRRDVVAGFIRDPFCGVFIASTVEVLSGAIIVACGQGSGFSSNSPQGEGRVLTHLGRMEPQDDVFL